MRTKNGLFFLIVALLVTVACKTTETKPVPWKEQSAYLATVCDPRIYGFSIYQTPSGMEYRGGTRVHPNQGAALSMKAELPLRPVVMLRGSMGFDSPVLLDFSSSASWFEFGLANKIGALPLGEREAQLFKQPGDEIASCLSMVPSMRLKQLFIERPLVNVRMATGSLGPLTRGIEEPELKGVIGWEVLRKFEQIQLNYSKAKVLISTSKTAYNPDPAQGVAKLPLVKYAGVCAVRGIVDGKEELILIDPAGDFEVATDGSSAVSSVVLDPELVFSEPAIAESPGGTRIGARLLQNYQITICPQAGWIYFEKLNSGKD
jgi:hypothetical protein